jgi:hypothetical protein
MYLHLTPNLLHFLPDLDGLYALHCTPNFCEIHPRSLFFNKNLLTSASTGCPVGYDDISGKCYAYFGDIDPQNRDVADNLCVSANAHLWIIDDEAEFDMVTDFYQLRKVI